MTLKSRLYATALAISLSTPAAAVTISLTDFRTIFQVLGPASDDLLPFFPTDRGTLVPAPVLKLWGGDPANRAGWEYVVDVFEPYLLGSIIASDCSFNFSPCYPEVRMPAVVKVGSILRFDYYWWPEAADGNFIPRPELRLTFDMPDGVTLSHMPLPASWLLFASMLGLGGLFRWAKYRAVAS